MKRRGMKLALCLGALISGGFLGTIAGQGERLVLAAEQGGPSNWKKQSAPRHSAVSVSPWVIPAWRRPTWNEVPRKGMSSA